MPYTAWDVVAFEQPTAAKWNQLGENDAGFKDGSNINAGAITVVKRSGGFFIGEISGATLGSTGNKAITGVGFTPKLVRFTIRVSGTSSSAFILSFGAMTATSQFYTSGAGDGTNAFRAGLISACIGWSTAGGTLSLLASYVSMDADGFTINVSTAGTTFAVAYEAYA